MKDIVEVSLGIIIAFFLYTILSKVSPSFLQTLNIFTLVVIYFAIARGEIFGALLGTFCGLIQDSFSLGVFGISSLTNTVTGYLAGYISGKINVIPLARNFVFIFFITSVELLLWIFLCSLIFSGGAKMGKGLIFFQPLNTALLGSLFFFFIWKMKKRHGKEQNL